MSSHRSTPFRLARVSATVLLALGLAACNDSGGGGGGDGDGDDGGDGGGGGGGDTSLNVQLRADDLGPGGACQFGGKMIFAGRDLNNNDRLDRSEVHTRETVCASEGQSLSVDFSEAGSSNTCPNGGRTATVGGEDYTFCHIAAGTDSGNISNATTAVQELDGWMASIAGLGGSSSAFGDELEAASTFAETGGQAASEAAAAAAALALEAFRNGGDSLSNLKTADMDFGDTAINSGSATKDGSTVTIDGAKFDFTGDGSTTTTTVDFKATFPSSSGTDFTFSIDTLNASNDQVTLSAGSATGEATMQDEVNDLYADGAEPRPASMTLDLTDVTLETKGGADNGNGMTFTGNLGIGPVYFIVDDQEVPLRTAERLQFDGTFTNEDGESFGAQFHARVRNADNYSPAVHEGMAVTNGLEIIYDSDLNGTGRSSYTLQPSDDFTVIDSWYDEPITVAQDSTDKEILIGSSGSLEDSAYSAPYGSDFTTTLGRVLGDSMDTWDFERHDPQMFPQAETLFFPDAPFSGTSGTLKGCDEYASTESDCATDDVITEAATFAYDDTNDSYTITMQVEGISFPHPGDSSLTCETEPFTWMAQNFGYEVECRNSTSLEDLFVTKQSDGVVVIGENASGGPWAVDVDVDRSTIYPAIDSDGDGSYEADTKANAVASITSNSGSASIEYRREGARLVFEDRSDEWSYSYPVGFIGSDFATIAQALLNNRAYFHGYGYKGNSVSLYPGKSGLTLSTGSDSAHDAYIEDVRGLGEDSENFQHLDFRLGLSSTLDVSDATKETDIVLAGWRTGYEAGRLRLDLTFEQDNELGIVTEVSSDSTTSMAVTDYDGLLMQFSEPPEGQEPEGTVYWQGQKVGTIAADNNGNPVVSFDGGTSYTFAPSQSN